MDLVSGEGAAAAAGVLAALVLALTLASAALAAIRLRPRAGGLLAEAAAPPVSIVRPVCGLERFSEATLGSVFRLGHPDYEVIFCVASSADPALPLLRRLMEAHPAVPSRLLVGDDRVSENPKLNNCLKGWEAARHPWVILADSNVLMPRDYVARLLAAWRSDTGLVCSTPAGTRPEGIWAEVECAFLNTLQARWQYAAEALGLGFAQGKSRLWYRPFLDARGGLRALGAEIAEDAAATKLVRAAGLRVHLVDRPFPQPLGRRSPGEVWRRQFRWARLRRVTFPLFFAPELLSGALVPAGLAAWAGPLIGLPPLAAALSLLAAWYGAEALLARRLGWPLSWRTPLAFLIRDLLVPTLWCAAFMARRVVWRGNAMRIDAKGPGALALGPSQA